jgi:ribosome biogenesis GTPase / thiamine phosphate phosphatase
LDLYEIGWTIALADEFKKLETDLIPARISSENKGSYMIMTEHGELYAKVSGKYHHTTQKKTDFPVVGDWVTVKSSSIEGDTAIIHSLLSRKTVISRKVPGESIEEQIISANVDYVFIVSGLDQNFNLRRIERFLTMVWNTGASPVVILNKVDLLESEEALEEKKSQIDSVAFGTPAHFISSTDNKNLLELTPYLQEGKTIVLLGSSGVGKSTLTNYLLGEEIQKTVSTREDDARGRHTTTRRQLFLLKNGALLIDTPGIRELQLWLSEENQANSGFEDIDLLAQSCHYADCQHRQEPKCSVLQAIEEGTLTTARLKNYHKLQAELAYLENRQKETSWDTRLKDRQHGKLRHSVIVERDRQNR